MFGESFDARVREEIGRVFELEPIFADVDAQIEFAGLRGKRIRRCAEERGALARVMDEEDVEERRAAGVARQRELSDEFVERIQVLECGGRRLVHAVEAI